MLFIYDTMHFEFRISKYSVSNTMAIVYPCSFSYKLVYQIKFDAPIRVYHVYKETWTTQKEDILYFKKDYRSEALDKQKHAVGIHKGAIH